MTALSSVADRLIDFLMKNPDQTNALVALAAVGVSCLSVLLTVWSVAGQRKHNRLSVRPLAWISLADYEHRVSVKLHNNGVGPLIIQKIFVSDGQAVKDNVIDWMLDLPHGRQWNDFAKDLQARSLAPGGEIVLLLLKGDPKDDPVNDAKFGLARDLCRKWLKKLTVELHYTDVYNRAMTPATRSLSWFGRHAADHDAMAQPDDVANPAGPVR
jgi:hypothetical protein